jgi:uncharacterized protein YqjF (DUF2071 family)
MTRSWIMRQRWEDLLFLSWPVPVEAVRPLVAPAVEVDTFDGSAWVSAVPFWMERARFRGLPPLPFVSSFPEVNVRTYVRSGEHRAVWFLTLETQSRINVALARFAFHAPYNYARVSMRRNGEIVFRSARPGGDAAFEVRYRGDGPATVPAQGTLEHFLGERYAMVGASERGTVYRGDIEHEPWSITGARWTADALDVVETAGVRVAGDPVAFYAAGTDVKLWAPVTVA